MYGPEWKTPQQYGAAGDGYTDDRQAFQLAIDSGYPVYVPYTPLGYVLGYRLRLPSGSVLRMSDGVPSLKLNSNDWLVEITGSEVLVSGLKADMGHLSSGGVVLLRSDETTIESVTIERSVVSHAATFVRDLPHATNRIVGLTLVDITAHALRDTGLFLTRSFAYQHVERVTFIPAATNTAPAIYQIGNEGAFWREVDVTNGTVNASNGSNHAFVLENCKANWIGECMADSVGGNGFDLRGCDYIYIDRCIASLNGGKGFSVSDSQRVTISSSNVGGRAGAPYAPSQPGFYVNNSPKTILDDGCRVYSATGAPVQIVSSAGARNNVMV